MNESAERRLRYGLQLLTADAVPPPTAEAVMRAGRVSRRRRRIAAVVVAGVVVLGGAAIAVVNRADPVPPVVGASPAVSASVSASPSPVVHDSGGDGFERRPGEATIGTPYRFDLRVHCGIRYATFAGRQWEADPVQPQYHARHDYRSTLDYVPGTMTLVGADELQFDSDIENLHVTFRPQHGKLAICD